MQLQQFNFTDSQSIRAIEKDNEPWFVAKDVCEILEIQNVTQALDRLDEDERSMFNIGRQGETNIINESGLYSLVLGSRKPEAKAFKKWVTSEVLPTIRKTGSYSKPKTQIEIILAQAQALVDIERKQKEQESRIEQLENKIEKRFTNDISLQLVLPTQLGKMFEPSLSAQKVNAKLRDAGLQWKVSGEWIPTNEGRPYSSSEPVQVESGKIVYQLKWQRRVKDLLV
jgi:anti-repressor protein